MAIRTGLLVGLQARISTRIQSRRPCPTWAFINTWRLTGPPYWPIGPTLGVDRATIAMDRARTWARPGPPEACTLALALTLDNPDYNLTSACDPNPDPNSKLTQTLTLTLTLTLSPTLTLNPVYGQDR